MKSSRITFILLIISFFSFSLMAQSWEVTIGQGPGDAKNETMSNEFSFDGVSRINDTMGVRFCRTIEVVDGVNYSGGLNAFAGVRRNFKPTKNNFRMQAGLKLNYSTLRFENWTFSIDELKYQSFDTIAISQPQPPQLPSPEDSDMPCDTIVSSIPELIGHNTYSSVDLSLEIGVGKGFFNNKLWVNVGGSFLYSIKQEVSIPYTVLVSNRTPISTADFHECRYINRFTNTEEGIEPINFLGYLNMQLYPIPSLGFEAGVRTYVSNIFTTDVNYTARPTYGYIAVNYKFGQRKKKESE